MNLVTPTEEGQLEINWQWLPTWIGVNQELQQEMQEHVAKQVEGLPANQTTINVAEEAVLSFLVRRFPNMCGLGHFLDALKFVEVDS